MTKLELADVLERFVGDKEGCDPWFFDDFTSTSAPAHLEDYQRRLREMDPPLEAVEVEEIRKMVRELRDGAA